MTTDYDFLPPTEPTDADMVIAAGRRINVLSLATGKQHPILQAAAEAHARYQAERCEQGHQHWDDRVKELYRLMPECHEFAEVCAESWPENNREEAAGEMYNSWRQSPGHWSAVNGRCDFWGYAMAIGSNGVWYATGQFGHLVGE
jgi:hypothetical protein